MIYEREVGEREKKETEETKNKYEGGGMENIGGSWGSALGLHRCIWSRHIVYIYQNNKSK